MSDHEVAQRIGCATKTVGEHRRALGIPPFNQKIWQRRIQTHILIDPTKLRARRLELNVSQESIGARAGIPFYYVKLEVGAARHVQRRTLERLAAALECPPDDLVQAPAMASENPLEEQNPVEDHSSGAFTA